MSHQYVTQSSRYVTGQSQETLQKNLNLAVVSHTDISYMYCFCTYVIIHAISKTSCYYLLIVGLIIAIMTFVAVPHVDEFLLKVHLRNYQAPERMSVLQN